MSGKAFSCAPVLVQSSTEEHVMKHFISQSTLVIALGLSGPAFSAQSDVGTDLYEKESIALDQIPAQALEAVRQLRPDFQAKEAEKELKHGNRYLDLEGVTGEGMEIEFDMLLNDNNQWEVVEIQRDVTLADCPPAVRDLYVETFESTVPDRIIESQQMSDVVVYEFYVVGNGGKTEKSEIKLEGEKATLLSEEWEH
jgi:predicted flavoprotein YhiN